jgi:hypothetical protein
MSGSIELFISIAGQYQAQVEPDQVVKLKLAKSTGTDEK